MRAALVYTHIEMGGRIMNLLLLLWHYSPIWAPASSTLCLRASLLCRLSTVPAFQQPCPLHLTTFFWAFQLVLSLPWILTVLSWAPFPPSSTSHDPPIGVFSIPHFWLAPLPFVSYKFHHYTCFINIH